VQVNQDDVQVSIDRGETISTLEIDIQLRNGADLQSVA
jgi:septum formation topological specificity factor MinE